MREEAFMDSIIGNCVAAANQEDIDAKLCLLPNIYVDALGMHFGPRKMSDERIAEVLNDDVNTHLNSSLVGGMINDAFYMVNHKLDKIKAFDCRLSAEQQKKHRQLSWDNVIDIMNAVNNSDEYQDWEDLREDLKEKYSEGDIITAPNIEELYYVDPDPSKMKGTGRVPEAFTLQEIEGIRFFAEVILVILDEIGVYLISDAPERGRVEAQDIYKYAYLKETFAKKIAYDNPGKLTETAF